MGSNKIIGVVIFALSFFGILVVLQIIAYFKSKKEDKQNKDKNK
jgi:hypothetical protein